MTERPDVRRDHGFHPLRVKQVVEETPDTRSYVLDVPDDLQDLFAYRPGQFCTFRVRVGDEELLRSYSMSSAPETDADLTVTVKRVPDGRVSGWFHENVSEGDVLEATKPAGVFCIREGERPLLAFVGGSGVTPVMSITKSALATTARPIRLLCANRDRASVIFDEQLEQLRGRNSDQLEVQHHLDDDRGFLDAAAIAAFLGADRDADFYLCGPTPFMDLVEKTLVDLGIDPDQIVIERFVNESAPVPLTEAPYAPEGDAPAEVTIILKGKRHTIAYHPGDTILHTVRRGGLSAPSSCEAGECATCMALVQEGTVQMRVNNALTQEEVDEGWVLTCQGLPQGQNVTVEYESF